MNIRTALVLSAFASAIAFTGAHAQVGAGVHVGPVGVGVGVGYNDGYYDNDHHWHHWRNHADMDRYRHEHADAYHDWRHDDPDHHDEDRR